jgi:hypothetical protein
VLSPAELLNAWERGLRAPIGARALELTALARPDLGETDLRQMTVGERDAELLELREALFGDALEAVLSCSGCGEALEASATMRDLRVTAGAPSEPQLLAEDAYEVTFRHPTAGDIADAAASPDAETAEQALLERCVLGATRAGQAVSARELPDGVVSALDEALAAGDPQADVELAITCPSCGTQSTTRFDIASFLWSEVDAFALATLREIHVLASAYGWSEDDIIALGPRRRWYLELVEG